MRFRPILLVTAGLIALWAGTSRAQPTLVDSDPNKLLSEIQKAAQIRCEAARTAKIVWNHKDTHYKGSFSIMVGPPLIQEGDVQPPHDSTHEGSGTMLLNSNQARISRNSMTWHISLKKFHNNRTESLIKDKQYSSLTHYGSDKWPRGRLSKDGWRNDAEILIWPILLALRGNDGSIVAGGGFQSYTSARRLVIEGTQCIELTREKTEFQGESKISCESRAGFPIRRIDSFQPDGKLASRIQIIANKSLNGVAFPSQWKITTFKNEIQLDSSHVTVASIDLQPTLAEADFSLDFPIGTYITDTQEGTQTDFIVRQDGSHRLVKPEERGIDYQSLMDSNTGDFTRRMTGRLQNSTVLTWIGAGLLLMACVLVAMRWKRAIQLNNKNSTNQEKLKPSGDL